jgi:hypothetical protein
MAEGGSKADDQDVWIPETRELVYLILVYNLEATARVTLEDQAEVVWRMCELRLEPAAAHEAITLLTRPDYS